MKRLHEVDCDTILYKKQKIEESFYEEQQNRFFGKRLKEKQEAKSAEIEELGKNFSQFRFQADQFAMKGEISSLEVNIFSLRKENAALKQEIDSLKQRIAVLEGKELVYRFFENQTIAWMEHQNNLAKEFLKYFQR